ncbi:MAG: hypothetical protein GY696_27770 [Gammaproteobacteria bacterium]|nr:hypothetical protein [Gammaproteobacteria bacterium]
MTTLFPTTPAITLHDPLADLFGAGDSCFHYTFDDVVKLPGHDAIQQQFRELWRERVVNILNDGGQQTITVSKP